MNKIRLNTDSGYTTIDLHKVMAITTMVTNDPLIKILGRTSQVKLDIHMLGGTIFTTKEMDIVEAQKVTTKWTGVDEDE